MPATTLFGCRLRQLATDFTPFYVSFAFTQNLFPCIYAIAIGAMARPQACEGSKSAPQQLIATWVLLAVFLVQGAFTVAAAVVSARGTPLEPSKRCWVTRWSYAYIFTTPVAIGVLVWTLWVLHASVNSCWSSNNKGVPASVIYGAVGVLLGQIVSVFATYNSLSDYEAGRAWHALTRTGLTSAVHFFGDRSRDHRGPPAALEELATHLQRMMAAIDGEKTDVAAGLVCAKLIQEEAAAAAAAPGRQDGKPAGDAIAAVNAVVGGNGGKQEESVTSQSQKELLAWADEVCQRAGDAVSAADGSPAGGQDTDEALHWARYAAAAYGSRQHMWRRGQLSARAARRQLAALAKSAAAEGAQPLAGWGAMQQQPGKRPTKAECQDFAAARRLLGSNSQIVCFSSGNEKQHLLPHLVAVDKEKQAVVLAVAGGWQLRLHVPDCHPLPAGWLEGGSCDTAAAEAGQGAAAAKGHGDMNGQYAASGTSSWVHRQAFEAAEQLWQELEKSQVLQQLLQPAPSIGTASSTFQGLDCSSWQLVLAGHGFGAGAAALLAAKLRSWQLGRIAVWAFAPPAQLCSGDVGAALGAAASFTAVVVGNDAGPRGTSAHLSTLVDQAVVGLARLRYSKSKLLTALVRERLGPKRWRKKGLLVHDKALRPLSEVPAEALQYLQRYRDWRQQQLSEAKVVPLPGRVLYVSRLHEDASSKAAPEVADASSSSSSAASERACAQQWQAGWVCADDVAGWSIRVSARAATDHYISRLLSALGDLSSDPPPEGS